MPPGGAFPLGTDLLGRDLLTRILYGARTSLVIGVASPSARAGFQPQFQRVAAQLEAGFLAALVLHDLTIAARVCDQVLALRDGRLVAIGPSATVLAPAPPGREHRINLTVEEITDELAPGVVRPVWTYNGGLPAPTLRGRVGDTFVVTFRNEGTIGHSIDFHAGMVSPDDTMRSIDPGESLVYKFTAQHSGIWLYHCSTVPMSEHLAAGMYGAVIIDPDGLADVDREYLLIQSETYLGPEGGTPDTAKISAKTPDLMSFNGVAFQYALEPLAARAGERVRFWVLDAGPSLPSSFHVVGLQFDTVFSEGAYLLGGPDELGRAWHGGSQALALQPAQGGFVEAEVPAAGSYSIVTHAFADMEKGAKGILRATA